MIIGEAKLNTLHMFENENKSDFDYELWQKIARYMDGEMAWVTESSSGDGRYVFLGLANPDKNKELSYMMEQDSVMGMYINDRDGFEKAWNNEEYEPDGCFYLEPQYLIFKGND